MKNKKYINIAIIIGIIVFANLISREFFFRLDLTEDKQYTLSKASRDILKNLEEPITVKAYFSENLPANIMSVRKDFKEMLIEYSSISKGKLVFEFVNPSQDDQSEKDAMQQGIQPIMIDVREKNQMIQQKAYLGAVITTGNGQKEIIPFVQPGGAMEYSLSTAIKKISVSEKPTIGIIQGHGEPGINEISQAYREMSILYQVEPLSLNDSSVIPDRIKTIAIIRPTDSISPIHLMQLDDFLSRGGNIFIAMNRVNGDFSTAMGSSIGTGLENWLLNKGIKINEDFVIDSKCGQVNVQQPGFPFPMSISFPYLPIAGKFADHPVTRGLEGVIFQFVSSIEKVSNDSILFTPLVYSSDKSGSLSTPLYFEVQKQWTNTDFNKANLVLGAAFEGKFIGNILSKLIIIADGDFAVGGNPQQGQAQQINPDNVSLMVNSIDWLSDVTGLIDLRTKGVQTRPIDTLEDGTKTTLKILNFTLPLILVIALGIIIFQINRNKRIKRLEENY